MGRGRPVGGTRGFVCARREPLDAFLSGREGAKARGRVPGGIDEGAQRHSWCSSPPTRTSASSSVLRRFLRRGSDVPRCPRLDRGEHRARPGAHLGGGQAHALQMIPASLDWCFEHANAPDVFAVLENTAGAGTVVGYRFEQLAEMMKGSAHPDRLGICVDTCHTFAAGYDFRTRDGYEALLRTIDETVGLGRIRAFHLNDSVGDLGSKLDRHADIGKGKLGKEAFRFLVNEERFRELPGCLEFPGADAGYRRNLKTLRSLVTGTNAPTAGPRPSGKRAGRGTA